MDHEETTDEIIREIRRIKEALAKPLDFDVDRILEDAINSQENTSKDVLFPKENPITKLPATVRRTGGRSALFSRIKSYF